MEDSGSMAIRGELLSAGPGWAWDGRAAVSPPCV